MQHLSRALFATDQPGRTNTSIGRSLPVVWQVEPHLTASSGGLASCHPDRNRTLWHIFRNIHSCMFTLYLVCPPSCIHAQRSSTDDKFEDDALVQGFRT